jgi:hypothetical protein
MKRSSKAILERHFPSFAHANCERYTFGQAVRDILKHELEGTSDAPRFVPDGWIVNKRRRELCILEIEDTNPLLDAKRDSIARLMWWLDDNMWHLHLLRVNAATMAFFFMNCDDIAAWDFSEQHAREWHFEETLMDIKWYFPLCEGKGSLKKREAYPSILGNLRTLHEGSTKRLFYRPPQAISSNEKART